ncbi:MAG: peptide-N-glycosidase F-related protein [Planctomycetota bacterium]
MLALGVLVTTAAIAAGIVDGAGEQPSPQSIQIFDGDAIYCVDGATEITDGDFAIRTRGQTVTRSITFGARPDAEHARVVLKVSVVPVEEGRGGSSRPRDPWNRLGSVTVDAPDGTGSVELMRFVTGFGTSGRFERDITAFAPLLSGRRQIELFLNTYIDSSIDAPAWEVSARIDFEAGRAGQRRPALVRPVFRDRHLTSDKSTLRRRVTIPPGLARPRIVLTSTGHATDGSGANEFVTCSHALLVDGRPVALWRPWAEDGPGLRDANRWAGLPIEGEQIRASDLDRSGWQPGRAVEPLIVPAAELTPGDHLIELRIDGIRAPARDDPMNHHGYWVVDAVVVADEPLPRQGATPSR